MKLHLKISSKFNLISHNKNNQDINNPNNKLQISIRLKYRLSKYNNFQFISNNRFSKSQFKTL